MLFCELFGSPFCRNCMKGMSLFDDFMGRMFRYYTTLSIVTCWLSRIMEQTPLVQFYSNGHWWASRMLVISNNCAAIFRHGKEPLSFCAVCLQWILATGTYLAYIHHIIAYHFLVHTDSSTAMLSPMMMTLLLKAESWNRFTVTEFSCLYLQVW